ncbi:MAG: DUF3999 family protein [Pirellulales bacterium]|nr:DUF3999 family protein [Pirellulales bacterium]
MPRQSLGTMEAMVVLRRSLGTMFAALLAMASMPALAADAPQARPGSPLSAWPCFQDVRLSEKSNRSDSPWVDFVLLPDVFDKARVDLADLRLYQGSREIPYALRVRREENRRDAIRANIFNRAQGPEGSTELSLDLGPESFEHNEVQVEMPSEEFRRRAVLEGSDNAQQWRELREENLIRFHSDSGLSQDVSLKYPPSRFRHLRLRVYQDPLVDKEPPAVDSAAVYRTVHVPGEMLTLPGALGPRELTRANGSPASAWIIGLGGESVPVEEIAVEVADKDFVRDYQIEVGGPEGSQERFRHHSTGVWRRRAGEEQKPMKAAFPEVQAARVRLVVLDHGNQPLEIRSASFSAPARQVVFASPERPGGDYRLYYGNRDAQAPLYDFARNLSDVLVPPPARASLGERQANPVYLPKPLPLTERWPWLIYMVLGSVSAVLGAVIVGVARRAIAVHDAQEAAAADCLPADEANGS